MPFVMCFFLKLMKLRPKNTFTFLLVFAFVLIFAYRVVAVNNAISEYEIALKNRAKSAPVNLDTESQEKINGLNIIPKLKYFININHLLKSNVIPVTISYNSHISNGHILVDTSGIYSCAGPVLIEELPR